MDVSPRTLTEVAPGPGSTGSSTGGGGDASNVRPPTTAAAATGGRRWRAWLLGAVVVVALGFVVFRGLGNATLFFYNADEAVAKKTELGTDRFRLQGSVVEDEVSRSNGVASFTVEFDQVDVKVRHTGDIPKLFKAGIPVVLEGRWDGDVFASDRMLIKHSEVYQQQNPDRVKDYEGASTTTGATP